MQDSTSLLRVTEGFYGAALGLESWRDALDRFGETVRADHIILNAITPSPFLATARVDESILMRLYLSQIEVADDAPPTEGVRNGEAVLGSALMPDADYVRTAHYNELIRPLGGRHSVFAKATAAAAGSKLYMCRGARHGDFDDRDAGTVAALMPHLSLAIALGARLVVPGRGSRREESLLEAFHGAALICDSRARLLGANSAVLELLEAADGIALHAARLVAINPAETERLRQAIANTRLESGESLPRTVRIRLPRRHGRLALSLRLVPVRQLGPDIGDPRSVAIFITEPDAALPVDRAAVAEAYGLAPREAELACLLASGASVAAIAAATGLRIGSVRVYLKRIFDKTGARSQSALVALLRGFV